MASDFFANLLAGALSEGQQRKQQGQELALKVAEGQATHPYQQMDELLKLLNIQSLVESRKATTEQREKAKTPPTTLIKAIEDIDSQLISLRSQKYHPLADLMGVTVPILIQRRQNILRQIQGLGLDTSGLEDVPGGVGQDVAPVSSAPPPEEELIPVLNPQGNPVKIRRSQLEAAQKKNYRLR